MASASLKGTRKTYSFEERRILISLINKHEIIESKKPNSNEDPQAKIPKRKSVWSLIAEEYNSLVGPQAARSAVQLRRCWENMKACKRNYEEKKTRTKAFYQWMKDETRERSQCWEVATCGQNTSEAPTSTGTVGLPPNVLFEPTDSKPFTLQSLCTARLQKPSGSKDADSCQDLGCDETFKQMIADKNKYDTLIGSYGPMIDCQKSSVEKNADSFMVSQSAEDVLERDHVNSGPSNSQVLNLSSHSVMQQYNHKSKSAQREEELQMLALSEAQMKVDIVTMLKEEAKIKLEEARYRKEEAQYCKEEARLKLLHFTYKLDRVE